MSDVPNPSLEILNNPPLKYCGGFLNPLDFQFPLRRSTPYFSSEKEVVEYQESMGQVRVNYFVFDQEDWLVHIGLNIMGLGPYAEARIAGDITTLTLDEAVAVLAVLTTQEAQALWQAEIEAHEFSE